MSMSTHVYGIRDLGGRFDDLMKIKRACDWAGTSYPIEVTNYFKDPGESEEYQKGEMEQIDISNAVSNANKDSSSGVIVDLSKLSDEVKSVMFLNSW